MIGAEWVPAMALRREGWVCGDRFGDPRHSSALDSPAKAATTIGLWGAWLRGLLLRTGYSQAPRRNVDAVPMIIAAKQSQPKTSPWRL